MTTIPIIASAADVPGAIRHANREVSARWYVAKRAEVLGRGDLIPKDWGITAAFGGDWSPPARGKAAKKGQATDSGSFPIKDKADLKRAIRAYGRAKNKDEAKKHIIKRAKALGATGELPDSWGVTASASVTRLPRRQAAGKIRGMTAAGWDADLHPRDRNGRFIEKFDIINVFSVSGGSEASYQGVAVENRRGPDGDEVRVRVTSTQGTDVSDAEDPAEAWVPVSRIESAPPAKATLNGGKDRQDPQFRDRAAPATQAENDAKIAHRLAAREGGDTRKLREIDAEFYATDEGQAFKAGEGGDGPQPVAGDRDRVVLEGQLYEKQGDGSWKTRTRSENLDPVDPEPQIQEQLDAYDGAAPVDTESGLAPEIEAEYEQVVGTYGWDSPNAKAMREEHPTLDSGDEGGSDLGARVEALESETSALGINHADNARSDYEDAVQAEAEENWPRARNGYRSAASSARSAGDDQLAADLDAKSDEMQERNAADNQAAAESFGKSDAPADDEDDLPIEMRGLTDEDVDEDLEQDYADEIADYSSRELAEAYQATLDDDGSMDPEYIDVVMDAAANAGIVGEDGQLLPEWRSGEGEDESDEPTPDDDEFYEDEEGQRQLGGDGSDIGSGSLRANPDFGVQLSQTTREDMEEFRDFLDVDSGRGAWASGLSTDQFDALAGYMDDWNEDPESVPSWASEKLAGLQEFADRHDLDPYDALVARRDAAQLGWSIEEQLANILNGEALDDQNRLAVERIADYLNNNSLRNASFNPEDPDSITLAELAGDLQEYLDGAYEQLFPEPGADAGPDLDEETGQPLNDNQVRAQAILDQVRDEVGTDEVVNRKFEDWASAVVAEADTPEAGWDLVQEWLDNAIQRRNERNAEGGWRANDPGAAEVEGRSQIARYGAGIGGKENLEIEAIGDPREYDFGGFQVWAVTSAGRGGRGTFPTREAAQAFIDGYNDEYDANYHPDGRLKPGGSEAQKSIEAQSDEYLRGLLDDPEWGESVQAELDRRGAETSPAPETADESASGAEGGSEAPGDEPDPFAGESAKTVRLMANSANKESVAITPEGARARIDAILTGSDQPEAAHKDLAKLMTELKLGGKQRKRYREALDAHFGRSGGDSAQTQAAAVAENLSDSNPVKEKLKAKASKRAAVDPKSLSDEELDSRIDSLTKRITSPSGGGNTSSLVSERDRLRKEKDRRGGGTAAKGISDREKEKRRLKAIADDPTIGDIERAEARGKLADMNREDNPEPDPGPLESDIVNSPAVGGKASAPAPPEPSSMSDSEINDAITAEQDRLRAETGKYGGTSALLSQLNDERDRRRRESLLRGEGSPATIDTPAGAIRAGDVIMYDDRVEGPVRMLVEGVEDDVKNGEPGFVGVLVKENNELLSDDKFGVDKWGYAEQAVSIVQKAPAGKA